MTYSIYQTKYLMIFGIHYFTNNPYIHYTPMMFKNMWRSLRRPIYSFAVETRKSDAHLTGFFFFFVFLFYYYKKKKKQIIEVVFFFSFCDRSERILLNTRPSAYTWTAPTLLPRARTGEAIVRALLCRVARAHTHAHVSCTRGGHDANDKTTGRAFRDR